ncbi:MAG: M28 family peptidase [Gemmataceae bacterium]
MTRFVAIAALAFAITIPVRAEEAGAIPRMRIDLTFLASPECEGRGPGTAGIDKAADYIAAAFKSAGLKGAMPDGSYFQPFTFKGSPTLGSDVSVELYGPAGAQSLKIGDDFQPLGLTGRGKAEGGLAFVGYSVTADAAHYDDFAGIDVAGKVVVMIRKCPRYSSDKPFVDDQTQQKVASLASKLENAQKHRAAAVLMVNDAAEKDDALVDFRFSVFGNPVDIPAFQIRRSLADAMLRSAANKSLVEVEEAINRDLKPTSQVLTGWTAKLAVSVERKTIGIKNVVATLEGAGPLANQTVVIGAHYDHLGLGGVNSLDPSRKPSIHFGADDNGSGTTALLELARRFGAMSDRQGRRLVFLAFSGEEVNLLGSAHYVKEPLFPLDNTTVMVNLDMVGRMTPDPKSGKGKIEVGGTGSAKGFDWFLESLNRKYDFALKKSLSGVGPSDHTSFYMKGVPVLFFFTGTHKEYHKPTDTVDRINFDDMSRIVDMVEDVVTIQSRTPDRPEYVKMALPLMSSGRGNVPRIGIMPGDYAEDTEGVPIASVTKDGPADKGGIKDGDRIVAIGGKPIKNMTAYMQAMQAQKRGEPIEIVVDRKGQRVTVTVTPQ